MRSGNSSLWLPVFVALIVYATVLAKGEGVLNDPDVYSHIAVGRWILAHWAVPHQDPFSHSMPGAPWVDHEWLSDVAMAGLYDHLGWTGLVVATALSFALAMALLMRALLRYLDPAWALVGVVTAWGMCFPHLLARPHIFALPLLAAWVAALVAARCEDRSPQLLSVIIIMLWANLHGSYMFGLVSAALFAGEAVFDAPDRTTALLALRAWGAFVALALCAALVTPNGISGLLLPLHLASMDFTMAWVNEWQSPNFQEPQPIEAWLLLATLAALFFGLRLPITRIAILLVLIHMALAHRRHGEILGIAAPLLVAPAFGPQLPRPDRLFSPVRSAPLVIPQSAMTLALVLASCSAIFATLISAPIAHDSNRFAPKAALAAVAANKVEGPVFNDYNFGGYLIFVGIAPFIDGRADMYGDDFLRRFTDNGELPHLLAQYPITWTLLRPKDPHVIVLDHLPGWHRLYTDDNAVVHVRERPAPLP
jgi:hypothetical protein